jgi:multicomponent Na+:H+ antiporter subunit G
MKPELTVWPLVGDVATALLLLGGALLMLLAALGLSRLPDLLTRMHVLSKAGTVGASAFMLAVALAIPKVAVLTRAIAVVAFLVLTAPIAAHLLARAAYFMGVTSREAKVRDDLEGMYDYDEHRLSSGEPDD